MKLSRNDEFRNDKENRLSVLTSSITMTNCNLEGEQKKIYFS